MRSMVTMTGELGRRLPEREVSEQPRIEPGALFMLQVWLPVVVASILLHVLGVVVAVDGPQ
jgi:hypothetical protein